MDERGPDLRGRRALRRSHHRQAGGVRAAREVHPHRHRPGGDLQERPGAHPDRRRRAQRAARSSSPSTARSRPTRRGSTDWWTQIDALAGGASAALRGLHRRRDQAAVPDPGALRGDRRRGDRHLRRRPAPDVGGAVLPLQRARASGSTRVGSARWASACPPRWARRSARPTTRCCVIAGDGSIQMNVAGARHLRAGADRRQGVHHEQRLPRHGPPVAGAVLGPPLQPGRHGRATPTSSSSPRPTVRPACASPTRPRSWRTSARRSRPPAPVVADVRVTREENTYPMIAPGAAARDMVG